jgi:hypothetical protein
MRQYRILTNGKRFKIEVKKGWFRWVPATYQYDYGTFDEAVKCIQEKVGAQLRDSQIQKQEWKVIAGELK